MTTPEQLAGITAQCRKIVELIHDGPHTEVIVKAMAQSALEQIKDDFGPADIEQALHGVYKLVEEARAVPPPWYLSLLAASQYGLEPCDKVNLRKYRPRPRIIRKHRHRGTSSESGTSD